jgi:hypothetical protein
MSRVRHLIQGGIRAFDTKTVAPEDEQPGHPTLHNGTALGHYKMGVRGETGRWFPLFGKKNKLCARVSNRVYFQDSPGKFRLNKRYGRPIHGSHRVKGRARKKPR